MKVSEALDKLKIGDTVWVKAKVAAVDQDYDFNPIAIKFFSDEIWLHEKDEISLTEPKPELIEVPSMIAKFIKENSDPIFEICAWSDHYGSDGRTCDDPELSVVLDWYGSNTKEFYEAVLNGYVVKQETIYHVLSETKNTYLCDLSIGDAAKRGGWLASFTDDKNKATPFEDREIAEAFATIVSGIVEEN